MKEKTRFIGYNNPLYCTKFGGQFQAFFRLLLWPEKLLPAFTISKSRQAGKTVQDKGEVDPTDLLVIAELILNYLDRINIIPL